MFSCSTISYYIKFIMKFFKMIARLNKYEIILLEDVKKREKFIWIGVCFVKVENNKFSNNKDAFFKYIKFVDKKKFLRHRKNRREYM